MPRVSVPKMTKAHYFWIIEEMPKWFAAAQEGKLEFAEALTHSFKATNENFKAGTFWKEAREALG